jgi:hypothetical protein
MSVANLYFIPLCFLFTIVSIVVIACFLKFQSLRKYRRKRNWLIYTSIILLIAFLVYQTYDQSLGPPIVRYTLEGSEPFLPNQVSPLQITVESLSRREMNFNLVIAAANASLIADSQSSIQVNRTAIKIPVFLRSLHQEVAVTVHFQMDGNVSGCAFHTALEPVKPRPIVTSSIEGAVSVWNNHTGKYTLEGIYGSSV